MSDLQVSSFVHFVMHLSQKVAMATSEDNKDCHCIQNGPQRCTVKTRDPTDPILDTGPVQGRLRG